MSACLPFFDDRRSDIEISAHMRRFTESSCSIPFVSVTITSTSKGHIQTENPLQQTSRTPILSQVSPAVSFANLSICIAPASETGPCDVSVDNTLRSTASQSRRFHSSPSSDQIYSPKNKVLKTRLGQLPCDYEQVSKGRSPETTAGVWGLRARDSRKQIWRFGWPDGEKTVLHSVRTAPKLCYGFLAKLRANRYFYTISGSDTLFEPLCHLPAFLPAGGLRFEGKGSPSYIIQG